MTSSTVALTLAITLAIAIMGASLAFAAPDAFAKKRGAADPAELINRPLNSCTANSLQTFCYPTAQ